jgi:hypothetical protein
MTSGNKHTPTSLVLVTAQNAPAFGFASITTGLFHSCARVASDNTAMCWGLNAEGQYGDDSTTNRVAASEFGGGGETLDFGGGFGLDFGGNGPAVVSKIYAGGWATCISLPSGAMECTGKNAKGQLGAGTIGGQSDVPVNVLNMPPA